MEEKKDLEEISWTHLPLYRSMTEYILFMGVPRDCLIFNVGTAVFVLMTFGLSYWYILLANIVIHFVVRYFSQEDCASAAWSWLVFLDGRAVCRTWQDGMLSDSLLESFREGGWLHPKFAGWRMRPMERDGIRFGRALASGGTKLPRRSHGKSPCVSRNP